VQYVYLQPRLLLALPGGQKSRAVQLSQGKQRQRRPRRRAREASHATYRVSSTDDFRNSQKGSLCDPYVYVPELVECWADEQRRVGEGVSRTSSNSTTSTTSSSSRRT